MNIVLVGASNNPEKFGNKILKDLISKGHNIIPINPKEDKIEGIKSFKKINNIPFEFEIINFVVKPEITNNILKENIDLLKNKTIWIQPGANNQDTKNILDKNGFTNYIIDSCIMLENL